MCLFNVEIKMTSKTAGFLFLEPYGTQYLVNVTTMDRRCVISLFAFSPQEIPEMAQYRMGSGSRQKKK